MANSIAFHFRRECSVAELKIKARAGFRKLALQLPKRADSEVGPYNGRRRKI